MKTIPGRTLVTFEPEEETKQSKIATNYQSRFLASQTQKIEPLKLLLQTSEEPKLESKSPLTKSKAESFWSRKKLITTIYDPDRDENKEEGEEPFSATHHQQNDHHAYNRYAIPCDWKLAEKHALAHITAPDRKLEDGQPNEVCPCCGFSTLKQELEFCSDPLELKFLGSGFPLFYNYLKYCLLLLTVEFTLKGAYNLFTNLQGTYCLQTSSFLFRFKAVHQEHRSQSKMSQFILNESFNCKQIRVIWFYYNCSQEEAILGIMQYLNFASIIITAIILLFFRRTQRFTNIDIDEQLITPADFTIHVRNIPLGLNLDYKEQLKEIFEQYAVLESDQQITVKKVVLVYDIEDLIEMEGELQDLISKKKKQLVKYDFQFKHPVIKLIDKEIAGLEHIIHYLEEEIQKKPNKFIGHAFVSFNNEDEKNLVLKHNDHSHWERFTSLFNHGITPNITEDHLQWNGQKLFIEEAPEPNAIDWECIYLSTFQKYCLRIKVLIQTFLFEFMCFFVIYIISLEISKKVDELHEREAKGEVPNSFVISACCYFIALLIVLFNKLAVGKILHFIVDEEKRTNKTEFQISFAKKFSFCLFMNAAAISYIIDIVMQGNIIGNGGFIYNESLVFILNAVLPPIIWALDPWSIQQDYKRDKERNKGNECLVTQEEANLLMEYPDYLSAKRYSDIMKTMWFTYFYATMIPLGLILSLAGLILYYFIDKYNLLRRRTVKESISSKLSEGSQILEYIILFDSLGEITVSYFFYKKITIEECLNLLVASCYFLLPMETITEKIFPRESNEEV